MQNETKTEIIFNFIDIPDKTHQWKFTGKWAVFSCTKNMAFEIKYIGPLTILQRIFKKCPDNIWVHEDRIEVTYVNTPGEKNVKS